MKKRGFTLIELLAVVVILVLISIVAFPPITNQISGSKDKVSDVTQELIYGAVETYMDNHQKLYPIVSGQNYCIKINELVNDGILETPVKDMGNGNEIDLDRYVKVEINTKNDINYALLNVNENCS